MGPPGFFSRVRPYGTTKEIGRQTTTTTTTTAQESRSQSTKLAIIDGPSLAHFIFDQSATSERADEKVEGFYKYAELGEATIEWLDNLCSFGFEIEGIYFDGALPLCKRKTRLDRLHRQTDSLATYKREQTSIKLRERDLHRAARKNLPKPPFLVTVVIESILDSRYSDKLGIVDGEADAFCAGSAFADTIHCFDNNIQRYFSIFTNDSDLIVWNVGFAEIIILHEMEERNVENAKILEGLCFSRELFRTAFGDRINIIDLVQQAFNMLDSRVTLAQAMHEGRVEMSSEKFTRFAAQYQIIYAMAKAMEQKNLSSSEVQAQPRDPRISELVHHYISVYVRKPELDLHGALSKAREKQHHTGECAPTSKNCRCEQVHITIPGWDMTDKSVDAWNEAQVEQQPIDPFRNRDEIGGIPSAVDPSKPSLTLEMFLPALLEDPAQAAAWRIGMPFRNAAESLLILPFDGYDTIVLENKRSGDAVVPRPVRCMSISDLDESMNAYLIYFRNALAVATGLDWRSRWRVLVMQLTLSNIHETGKRQPKRSDIIKVINGEAFADWSTMHLFAQYQAEYFSLRMLKDIVDFCKDRAEFKVLDLPVSLFEFADMLGELPRIADFYGTHGALFDGQSWETLANGFA